MKKGRILVEGSYQTIFGNPYEFLCATIDKNYEPTESLLFDKDEAYTTRFDDGDWLLCVRSPHITMGNLYIARNHGYTEIDEYFNLTSAIVCVNAIGNNIQQRLNGCDYDSDTMLVTPNPFLCDAVNEEYYAFGVPVCCVSPTGKTDYENTPEGLAKLDRAIANNLIGDIVNLSQFLNSLYWNEIAYGRSMEDMRWLYYDICKLAVLSGMEIDKAKRMYAVDANKVLRLLKKPRDAYKKHNNGKLPDFFRYITEGEAPETDSTAVLNTPMSFLYDTVESYKSRVRKTKNIPLLDLFELDAKDDGVNDSHKKQNVIKIVSQAEKDGGTRLRYYDASRRDNPGDYFPLPKAIFRLGLDSGEIAVYSFLMYCEDRNTFKCHPSYTTIGSACSMSKNTVRKYVESLERKGFIYTEPTMVKTRDGRSHNGSLEYTLRPIKPIEDAYFERQIREAEARMRYQNAMRKYEKKGGN